jgi:predicted CoA-binding protein
MNPRETIDLFLNSKKIAIAGVSHNPKKFGYAAYKTARDKGFDVIPVNKKGGNVDGIEMLKSVSELDPSLNLLIVTNKQDTKKVLEDAIGRGIKNIWIQNGCESEEALKFAAQQDIQLVSKKCFLMYSSPSGIHKFHQTITRWLGKYVKESLVMQN